MKALIDRLNGVLRSFQQYLSHITAHIIHVFPGFHLTSTRLAALKCLAKGHSHEKNPEDPVRLESRTPGLRVKQRTTEPRGTFNQVITTSLQCLQCFILYQRQKSSCKLHLFCR